MHQQYAVTFNVFISEFFTLSITRVLFHGNRRESQFYKRLLGIPVLFSNSWFKSNVPSLKGCLSSLHHHIISLQWGNNGRGSPEEFWDAHHWRYSGVKPTKSLQNYMSLGKVFPYNKLLLPYSVSSMIISVLYLRVKQVNVFLHSKHNFAFFQLSEDDTFFQNRR